MAPHLQCNTHCLQGLSLACCGVTRVQRPPVYDICHRCRFLHVSVQIPLVAAITPSLSYPTTSLVDSNAAYSPCLSMSRLGGLHVTCQNVQLPHRTAVVVTCLRGQTATSADTTLMSMEKEEDSSAWGTLGYSDAAGPLARRAGTAHSNFGT